MADAGSNGSRTNWRAGSKRRVCYFPKQYGGLYAAGPLHLYSNVYVRHRLYSHCRYADYEGTDTRCRTCFTNGRPSLQYSIDAGGKESAGHKDPFHLSGRNRHGGCFVRHTYRLPAIQRHHQLHQWSDGSRRCLLHRKRPGFRVALYGPIGPFNSKQ